MQKVCLKSKNIVKHEVVSSTVPKNNLFQKNKRNRATKLRMQGKSKSSYTDEDKIIHFYMRGCQMKQRTKNTRR